MTTSRRHEQDGSGIKGSAENWPFTDGWMDGRMGCSICDARGLAGAAEAWSHLQEAWRFACKGDTLRVWVTVKTWLGGSCGGGVQERSGHV